MRPVIEYRQVGDSEADPIYVCGHCRMIKIAVDRNTDLQFAENCCLCERCHVSVRQGNSNVYCKECEVALRAERHTAEVAKLEALPEVDDDGGPVYWGDQYYSELESAVDAFDDDPASAVVHPCTVSKAHVPDLVTYVEESLADNFEDAEQFLSTSDRQELQRIEKVIEAPEVWYPRLDVRLKRSWLNND